MNTPQQLDARVPRPRNAPSSFLLIRFTGGDVLVDALPLRLGDRVLVRLVIYLFIH